MKNKSKVRNQRSKVEMRACSVIEIVTPERSLLNGLWFGSRKPRIVVIWVHGLGGSAFSKLKVVQELADKNTAVITFNNRGHDKVSKIASARKDETDKMILGGSAHEVFTDCVDDIQGAVNFARRAGVKHIYLAGHSTGCQKSVYWASKKGRLPARRAQAGGVEGIILLAPISDYSVEMHLKGERKVARGTAVARALVRQGKKHQLLSPDVWPEHIDAQRFLSLYTPDSKEEMFTYAQPSKTPRLLQSVKLPVFAVFAADDEFADRPATDIAEWFERNTGANLETLIVPRATHSFHGKEANVASAIKNWMRQL